MVPSTWLSVVFFAVLIAPGLLFDLLAEHRRVGAQESTFREVSRVVLASLVFSGLGFLVVGAVRATEPAWMPDPRRLLANPHDYVVGHYQIVLWAFVLQCAVAVGAVGVVHHLLARKQGSGLRTISSWRKVFRDELPAGTLPHARVRLTNGTVFVGQVAHYTADLDIADREIVLAPPLYSKTADNALAAMPVEWQRVILPASVVESISVQYRPRSE